MSKSITDEGIKRARTALKAIALDKFDRLSPLQADLVIMLDELLMNRKALKGNFDYMGKFYYMGKNYYRNDSGDWVPVPEAVSPGGDQL